MKFGETSDWVQFLGSFDGKQDCIMGHEFVTRIEELGDGVVEANLPSVAGPGAIWGGLGGNDAAAPKRDDGPLLLGQFCVC